LFLGYVGFRLGGTTLGLYATATLIGCGGYIMNSHLLTLDGALCAFLIVAFGAFVIAQARAVTPSAQRHWMWLAWAAMAGATLSKGLIGVVIPGASLVLYTLVTRDFALWRRLHLVSGTLIYLALAAPWFIAVSRANPEFFDFFFIHEHFTRYLTVEHRRVEPWWYFIPLLVLGMLPWTFVLVARIRSMWREAAPAANGFSWQRFAIVWAAFVFLFFSASGSKLASYILPAYPPLCLVAAWLIRDIDLQSFLRWTLPPTLLVVLLAIASAFAYEPIAEHWVTDATTLASAHGLAPWLTAALAAWAIGGIVASVAIARGGASSRTAAVLAMALSTLVCLQLGLLGYDNFRTTRSSRDILRAAEAANGPFANDAPFYHVHMYDQTTPFYLRRTTTFVSYRDEFALGQDAEPERAIADEAAWIALWDRLPKGYAMMPVNDYVRFSDQGVPMRSIARDARRVLVSRR
jgi:4-amino-4-deoxy-L-arabinose transferase-like glycosyltransferase